MNMEGERMFFQDVVQRTFTDGGPGGGHLIPGRWSNYADGSWIDKSEDTLLSPFYTAVSMVHAGRDATEAKAKELYDLQSKIARMTPYQRHASDIKTPDEMLFSESEYKYRYFLIRILLPASARASEIAYRGKMHHEAVLTILALERWRLEKDHYPVSLNDLKAAGLLRELPADPYSDKSLVYKRMGDDCILYSVGPNFKDDDGQVGTVRGRPMRWGTSESGDIVLWPLLKTRVQPQKPSKATFKDQSKARALYGKMTEAIRKAETLSYESCLRDEVDGEKWYRVWMKKPNFFYVETTTKDGANHGILVGDGQYAWSYWPNGRPWFSGEDRGEGYIKYQKTRFNVYMKEPAPPGKFSISYAKILQKSNCFPVVDPSVFQGISNSLEPYIEGVRCLGVEKVGQEDCDVIEVSYMNRQRSYYFWISRRDNLPRKLEDVVRTGGGHVTREVWSKVTLNARIPMEKFRWTPPEGWKQWHLPTPEDRLLKPGRQAPDFELLSANETKITLSGYRDKVVWLTFWRVGCPPCREEIPYLEELYSKYKGKGLIVLGFDFADERQIALDFLRQHSVTFPNVLDTSEQAIKTGFMAYGARAAPVNYIIDHEGKITDAWLGYDQNGTRGVDVLAKLGIK
jgi:peroxiredoxin/outer membrane lipoprotein-sorting protein